MRLPMPLGSHSILRTTDVDTAHASIAASLSPHRLLPLSAVGFRAQHNAVELGRVTLHYIDYGAEVEVRVDDSDFHLVQIPLAGVSTITSRSNRVVATPRHAALTDMGAPVRMHFSAGNPRLMVRIGTSLLRDRLALARRPETSQLPSAPVDIDLARGLGRAWRHLLDLMLMDIDRNEGLTSASPVRDTLELALVDGLVATLTDESQPGPEAIPHTSAIRRAARLIEDHCSEPLGTLDIAEAVGLSARALRAGFQSTFAATPMAYLRRARLERVRATLSDGTATSVTDAALQCGVTHLGRLSGDYRATFGELPSETLDRATR